VRMLADGFTTRRGRRGALLHHDAINHNLRGRRGARLTALTSGGAIPDTADYQVVLEPQNQPIGSVNEDFAVESMAGDIFQLGNISYRILRVERGLVRVEDARGEPPTLPFWLGEAPGRSAELSQSVSRLRAEVAARLRAGADVEGIVEWLVEAMDVARPAAEQMAEYLAAAHAALGCLPTQDRIVFERFFDEAGGMQLVVHSPYGGRINRAWGLALRKRFCRKFNFELQAAATEDNIILSLTTAHSFDLADVARYLHSASVRTVLIQAMLDAPMFATRWRWVAGISLAIPRMRGGKRVPPQFTRMEAEDLVAAVFPDQIACAENLVGEREVPDHPLVNQTIGDCLNDAMDIEGLERLLKGLEAGEIAVVACDLTEPSPLSHEVLSAKPYAFLDDAPLEERRTQAVMARRWMDPETAGDIGRLDPEAIARVRSEAWPDPANADELHDSLAWLGFLATDETAGWEDWLQALAEQNRVMRLRAGGVDVWIAAELFPQFRALWPQARPDVLISAADGRAWSREAALVEILRGRLEGSGPVSPIALGEPLGLKGSEIDAALNALQSEGFAMRGRFTAGANTDEWCDRRLLARIHNYTVKRLRAEIEPVAARDFMRFLFAWQHVAADERREGPEALAATVKQLEGFEAPASAWESEILAARITDYEAAWLDDECLAGRVAWARLRPRSGNASNGARGPAPVRATPITLIERRSAPHWRALSAHAEPMEPRPRAKAVADFIREHGASFFDELVSGVGMLRTQVEEALAELVSLGLVTSDSFVGLRALLVPSEMRKLSAGGRRKRRTVAFGVEDAGRWALTRQAKAGEIGQQSRLDAIEHAARILLLRYGVVFWRVLEREAGWLPPWRDLLRVYRRLEARGEIRGGRFVTGFSGEQFALPEAIGLLRETRRKKASGDLISLSGADPLNLVGILTPGAKLSPLAGNRVLYRDGLPVATSAGGETHFFEELDPGAEWQARKALAGGSAPTAALAAEVVS
jgi:ATP-dependent Lhr-like helicase